MARGRICTHRKRRPPCACQQFVDRQPPVLHQHGKQPCASIINSSCVPRFEQPAQSGIPAQVPSRDQQGYASHHRISIISGQVIQVAAAIIQLTPATTNMAQCECRGCCTAHRGYLTACILQSTQTSPSDTHPGPQSSQELRTPTTCGYGCRLSNNARVCSTFPCFTALWHTLFAIDGYQPPMVAA
jgi:hypothetical protein